MLFYFIRAPYAPPVNWNFKSGAAAASAKDRIASNKDSKGIDVEAVGTVNGVSIHEFDLDSVDDKPWRKPGKEFMLLLNGYWGRCTQEFGFINRIVNVN